MQFPHIKIGRESRSKTESKFLLLEENKSDLTACWMNRTTAELSLRGFLVRLKGSLVAGNFTNRIKYQKFGGRCVHIEGNIC